MFLFAQVTVLASNKMFVPVMKDMKAKIVKMLCAFQSAVPTVVHVAVLVNAYHPTLATVMMVILELTVPSFDNVILSILLTNMFVHLMALVLTKIHVIVQMSTVVSIVSIQIVTTHWPTSRAYALEMDTATPQTTAHVSMDIVV